jgi:glycerol uptake facilitator-like aquaporin
MFPGESFISPLAACLIEAWGTGVLAFVIFAFSDERNRCNSFISFSTVVPCRR